MIGQVFKGLAMEAEQALAELLLSVWGEVLSPPEEAPCSPRLWFKSPLPTSVGCRFYSTGAHFHFKP